MLRKVLVFENALADNHPALDRALQLARQAKIELKVVDVLDGPSDPLHDLHRSMRSLVEQERKERLYSICERIHEQHIEFSMELLRGRPFVEIVRAVVHEGFHVVIKTAAGAERTDILGMMGPVDLRLVRNCPCPVWFEPPVSSKRSGQVVVAIDPQAQINELNEALLGIAASLAKTSGQELHIVSTWQVPDESILVEKMKPEKLAQYAADLEAAAKQSLDTLLSRLDDAVEPANVHFRKGQAATTILDYVESHSPDVLVIGTASDSKTKGLLIGDTADSVLRQINCPVLAVKPDNMFRA